MFKIASLKKVGLMLFMGLTLSVGSTQLFAVEILEGQACCPDTYNGGYFILAAQFGYQVRCSYSNGSRYTC